MEKNFELGDRVVFNGTLRFRDGKNSIEIDVGDEGTVCDPQFPKTNWVVTVILDNLPERPVTVPTDIVDPVEPEEEPEEEEHEECQKPPAGFILLHEDGTGEPVMYREHLIDGFGDGYILLKDGGEFDCEESIEDIAKQFAKNEWMF